MQNIILTSVNICPKCGSDVSQVIPRLADLGESNEEQKAREREVAKRELILGVTTSYLSLWFRECFYCAWKPSN
jgi:hypothetical protein